MEAKNIFDFLKQYGRDDFFELPDTGPGEPTSAEPGSKEKVAVMRRRLEQGKPLWHPDDKRRGENVDLS